MAHALAPFCPSKHAAPPSPATRSSAAEDVKLFSPAQPFYPCPQPRAAGQALDAASAASEQLGALPQRTKAGTPSLSSRSAWPLGSVNSSRSCSPFHSSRADEPTPAVAGDLLEESNSERVEQGRNGADHIYDSTTTSPIDEGREKGRDPSSAEDVNNPGKHSVRAPTSSRETLSSDPQAQWPKFERLWSPEEVRLLRESHLRHTRSVELTDIKKVMADFAATFPDSTRSNASIQRRCREMFPLRPTVSTSSAQPASRQPFSPRCGAREELDVGIIYDGGCSVRIENCPRNHYVAVYSSSYVKITRELPSSVGIVSFGHLFHPVFLFHRLENGAIRALRVPQGTTANTTSVLGGRPGGSTRGAVAVDELFRSPNGFSVMFRTAF